MKNGRVLGPIRGVIFDFDGTLTEPGLLDFSQIKAEIGCPLDVSTLDHIESLKDPLERKKAESILLAHEARAARESRLAPGAREFLDELHAHRVPCGILTRNSRSAMETAISACGTLEQSEFVATVTRDDGLPLKPEPGAVHWLAKRMGVSESEMVVIGDYVDDVTAGRGAGAVTVYLRHGRVPLPEANACVDDLEKAMEFLLPALPLRMGKLPNEILASALEDCFISDKAAPNVDECSENKRSVVAGPSVGEDAAVVSVNGVIAVCADPVTLASGDQERYAVVLNANDLSVIGAEPCWFAATCLLPVGTTGMEAADVIRRLRVECRRRGIELIGGHTEVTDGVSRPVVAGTMIGKLLPGVEAPLLKRDIRPGDALVMVGAAGLEGTGILAAEWAQELETAGLDPQVRQRAVGFSEEIDISGIASALARSGIVRAMHDVTEGGVAGAVRELCEAATAGIDVDLDSVTIRPETDAVCRALGLDPLGLLGSGALLVVVSNGSESPGVGMETETKTKTKTETGTGTDRMGDVGVDQMKGILACAGKSDREVSLLGRFHPSDHGLKATRSGWSVPFPYFGVDELARYYAERDHTGQ